MNISNANIKTFDNEEEFAKAFTYDDFDFTEIVAAEKSDTYRAYIIESENIDISEFCDCLRDTCTGRWMVMVVKKESKTIIGVEIR